VARVLDGKSVRGPVARSFAVGVFVGAVLVAAPLAALTLTPGGPRLAKPLATDGSSSARYYGRTAGSSEVPSDLPHLIASGVSTSVTSAVAAIAPSRDEDFEVTAPSGATVTRRNGTTVSRSPGGATVTTSPNGVTVASAANGGTVTVYPPDANGKRKVVAVSPSGSTAVSYVDAESSRGKILGKVADRRGNNSAVDRAIEMKAVGLTPEYVASIRSVLPQLRLSSDDLVQLKAVGVSPDFIQELARRGYRNVDVDDLTGAYAVGVRTDYIRGMAAVGYPRISLEDLTQLRAVGVTPADVERFRRAGFTHLDGAELVEAKTLGLTPEEIRASREGP
jgi:hypothetical protein